MKMENLLHTDVPIFDAREGAKFLLRMRQENGTFSALLGRLTVIENESPEYPQWSANSPVWEDFLPLMMEAVRKAPEPHIFLSNIFISAVTLQMEEFTPPELIAQAGIKAAETVVAMAELLLEASSSRKRKKMKSPD